MRAPEGRRTASISHRENGAASPVPAALRNASLAAKSAAALQPYGRKPARRARAQPLHQGPARLLCRPNTRRTKAGHGPRRGFFLRATSHRSHPMPYSIKRSFSVENHPPNCMDCQKILKQNVQIRPGILKFCRISCTINHSLSKGVSRVGDATAIFSIHDQKDDEIHEVVQQVYDALKEKGYNPINSWWAISSPKIRLTLRRTRARVR